MKRNVLAITIGLGFAVAACGGPQVSITDVSSVTCQADGNGGQSCAGAISYSFIDGDPLADYQVDAALDLAAQGHLTLTGSKLVSTTGDQDIVWAQGSLPTCIAGEQSSTVTLLFHDVSPFDDHDQDEGDVTISESGTVNVQCQ